MHFRFNYIQLYVIICTIEFYFHEKIVTHCKQAFHEIFLCNVPLHFVKIIYSGIFLSTWNKKCNIFNEVTLMNSTRKAWTDHKIPWHAKIMTPNRFIFPPHNPLNLKQIRKEFKQVMNKVCKNVHNSANYVWECVK